MLSVSQSVAFAAEPLSGRSIHTGKRGGEAAEQTGHPKDTVSDFALLPQCSFFYRDAAYTAE